MSKVITFAKNWTLPISILSGIAGYCIYTSIPFLDGTHEVVGNAVSVLQPLLIFTMLFLTFCKIRFSELRLTMWHLWLISIQIVAFVAGTWACLHVSSVVLKTVIEGFMLCMICPTATAAAVITARLGGNSATLTTYTVLINFVVALVVPTFVPMLHPQQGQTFVTSFVMIVSKVFPLLFCPFLLAMLLRKINSKITERLATYRNLPFYLWAVSLTLAIGVTVKSMVHTNCSTMLMLYIATASAIACALQFFLGRFVGRRYDEPISGAQSLGQKNTVFGIWMGYTFMSPITSLAGGFYSVWHNIYNSWQLYHKQHADK